MLEIKKEIERNLENGNLNKAENLINHYEKIHPKDMDLLMYKIIYNIYSGNHEIAEELCLYGIQKHPTCGDLYYNLGYIYEIEEDLFNSYENYYKAAFLYANFETDKKTDTGVEQILINLKHKINALYKQAEAENDYEILNICKKTYELEDIFFGLSDSIYTNPEKNVIGTKRWLNKNEKRFIARKTALKEPLFDDNCHNLIHGKGEMLTATKGSQYLYKENVEAYLPIASVNKYNIHDIYVDDKKYTMVQKNPNSYDYYRLKTNTYIKSKEPCYYGTPIPIGHSPKRKKLVLNIFLDGLSQTVLEDNLEKLMPNTALFFKDGMIYKNAHSNADWTYPSIAGAVSGLFVLDNKCFHPNIDTMMPQNVKLLAEYFKDTGYYTAKIDSDWRCTARYGHTRGYDRVIYQNQGIHYDIRATITDVIEHIEAFKDTDLFIWTGIGDLHTVADEMDMPTPIQNRLLYEDRAYEAPSENSVLQMHSTKKTKKYIEYIKYADTYMGLLFSYIKNNYKDEDILISLFADHGQGYLVPNDEHFICRERSNIAFMFKDGKHSFVSDELVSLCDYSAIICTLAGITYNYDNSAVLPSSLGGENGREFAFTECYHPGEPYRITFYAKDYTVYFEGKEPLGDDGRVSLVNYDIFIVNKDKETINDKALEQKYIDIVFKRMEEYLIYTGS